jgi:hypothetical protein
VEENLPAGLGEQLIAELIEDHEVDAGPLPPASASSPG